MLLKIRDENGVIHEIVALKGEKGADGTVSFDELTDAQKAELAGQVSVNVDQELDEESANALSNKAVFNSLVDLKAEMQEGIDAAHDRINTLEPQVETMSAQIGDIEAALNGILAIQNGLIGGAAV